MSGDDSSPSIPGSFDPLTNGHVDIIQRGARLFDRIIVAVLVNAEKSPLFTVPERVEIVREVFTRAAQRRGGHLRRPARRLRSTQAARSVIVRGLRAVSDFEFEIADGADEPAAESGRSRRCS